MTAAELRYCAGICRRAAERSEDVWNARHIVTASSRQVELIEMNRHAGAAFLDAAALFEAVADEPDGAERIRTVARLYECSEPEERMLAWAWVELLLAPAT